jgi:DNA-binding transcriptional regulator GbsR (MarR family)
VKNKTPLTAAEQQFVEDMGQYMVGWHLPRTTGRIYGYLLLQAAPVGLDELAAALGIAKSGASVGARALAAYGFARARGERGSRRLRYEALRTFEAILAARNRQVLELIARLREGARVATAGQSRRQLHAMADRIEGLLHEVQRQLGAGGGGGR